MAQPTKSDRTAVMLSVFVYPGAGQFAQKRWLAGSLFSVSFTLLFVLLMVSVILPLYAYLNDVLDFAAARGMGTTIEPQKISFVKVALYILTGMVVYFANLADVIFAHRRKAKPPPLPLNLSL